jgi:hypothetical protein
MFVQGECLEAANGRNTTGQPGNRLINIFINSKRAADLDDGNPDCSYLASTDDALLEEAMLEYIMTAARDGKELDSSDWDVLDVTGGIPSNVKEINSTELWKSIRKMSNSNVKCVLKVLRVRNSLVFKDLMKETGLSSNDLNHALYDLKQLNLVIQLDDKRYYLTKYCIALLSALKFLKEILNGLSHGDAISPCVVKSVQSD